MPEGRTGCSVLTKADYVYVIGGYDPDSRHVNTVYQLSLKTYKWTTMAPMGTERYLYAAVLQGGYIYIYIHAFGGIGRNNRLASAERYSIANNTWEDLPDMSEMRCGHSAVAAPSSSIIYITGGFGRIILELFDAISLRWKRDSNVIDMPEKRKNAAVVMLQDRYSVVIGGRDRNGIGHIAGSFICDCTFNCWSSTPASMDMSTERYDHTAAELDGNIIVAGGYGKGINSSMESVGVCSFDLSDSDRLFRSNYYSWES